PADNPLALGFARLRFSLRRHQPRFEIVDELFGQFALVDHLRLVLELIEGQSSAGLFPLMALEAVLNEERLDIFRKGRSSRGSDRFNRGAGFNACQQHGNSPREGGQSGDDAGAAYSPARHTLGSGASRFGWDAI